MKHDHMYYLRRCVEVSKRSGNTETRLFGAILVDKEGNILLEQENVEITEHIATGHAETILVQEASRRYDKKFCGIVLCIQLASHVPCAQVQYTGRISERSSMG